MVNRLSADGSPSSPDSYCSSNSQQNKAAEEDRNYRREEGREGERGRREERERRERGFSKQRVYVYKLIYIHESPSGCGRGQNPWAWSHCVGVVCVWGVVSMCGRILGKAEKEYPISKRR